MRSLALVQSLELQGGFHLLIGRDVRVRAQLRSLLTDALLWALLVVLVMAHRRRAVVRSLFRRASATSRSLPRRSRPATSPSASNCPAAAMSSISSPKRSTTCWTAWRG